MSPNTAYLGQNLDLQTQQFFCLTQLKFSSNSEFRQVCAGNCRKIVDKNTLHIECKQKYPLNNFCVFQGLDRRNSDDGDRLGSV